MKNACISRCRVVLFLGAFEIMRNYEVERDGPLPDITGMNILSILGKQKGGKPQWI